MTIFPPVAGDGWSGNDRDWSLLVKGVDSYRNSTPADYWYLFGVLYDVHRGVQLPRGTIDMFIPTIDVPWCRVVIRRGHIVFTAGNAGVMSQVLPTVTDARS